MQPGHPFYIHSVAAEDQTPPLVITCEDDQRKNSAWFNMFPALPCYLEEWVKDDPAQLFTFDEAAGTIKD